MLVITTIFNTIIIVASIATIIQSKFNINFNLDIKSSFSTEHK
jgi:hypothetical protein